METLRNIYNLVREIYGPLFPSSKAKKEKFLEKVRNKVEYYQPKIEEICAVEMGDINVKDIKYWLGDFANGKLKKEFENYASKKGLDPSRFDKAFLVSPILTARILASPIFWTFINFWGIDMKHYNSSIYVPFSYMNRFMDLDFKKREQNLDQTVVHELSHRLWYSLGGDDGNQRNWRLWNEGFATYCSEVHFLGLYPQYVEIDPSRGNGIHQRGREKIEELVSIWGNKIILQVPKRWEEFNASINR